MHVPLPLVIVIVAEPLPPPVQTPLEVIATGNPELAVAATVKVVPFAALAGAWVVTVIVWSALLTVNVPLDVTVFPALACTVKIVAPAGVIVEVEMVRVDVFGPGFAFVKFTVAGLKPYVAPVGSGDVIDRVAVVLPLPVAVTVT